MVQTAHWADVETPYQPPSVGQPDLGDVSALVNKFRSAPGAPIKARALLAGEDAAHNLCSTAGGAPCILMNVHPGLLHCGDGRLATTSFAVAARMGLNNLLTVHS